MTNIVQLPLEVIRIWTRLEHVMYESDQGFSMLNGKTITISKSQCEMLEGIKKKEKIKYTHISQ